ncbi:7,8-didemethyl-8-hydroxy-5-deazariboflavin synthase CofG [Pseudarthrobacter sp. fls2-241-R2A-168]|uniref:7,8-didemethyl-8-hydroxy-5-deazariboflavin synthase CofG n=1 Tax=Pseudarthrobacter sp. fls2-241-R2A-168 TaxID=3040304 RepID=UPI00255558D1|nr:7,8-didemethyl-8-hydroxy-5-deazariboflavin synthase CofG [Pseudarthrobacter sp. fls2-241-R2A-168]
MSATPRRKSLSAFDAAVSSVVSGAELTVDEAEVLLGARGDDLKELLDLASASRDAGLASDKRPGIITYSRKIFIPLTTLCRDRCHYCVFVETPNQLAKMNKPSYMSAEQVLAVARQGAALGCKEALLTLGDRPEDRWPDARAWLTANGYTSTLEYVGAMAALITRETGMLAHLNPGVMSLDELRTLRPVAPSMGMMLETTSRRLFEEPGGVHYGSPDKDPAVRMRTIEDAGIARIPFTTGILVGIGETAADRAESLVALRDLQAKYGHIQEVIVQNFRAKSMTAMQNAADATWWDYISAVAVARLVMGSAMRIQVPPNLSDVEELGMLVRAGIDDWGGVSPLTADHVNPERPWPNLDNLAVRTADLGFSLRERLTAHPGYLAKADKWLDPAIVPATMALADPASFLARVQIDGTTTRPQARPDLSQAESAGPREPDGTPLRAGRSSSSQIRSLVARAADDPSSLDNGEWVALLEATGDDLDVLALTADSVRRYTVGEAVSIVVNRNVSSSAYRTVPCGDPGTYNSDELVQIALDAWELGATELCVQGLLPADEDPKGYVQIARAIKSAVPRMHLHAFRPQDINDLATRGGLGLSGALGALREAGVDTVPGTGVKVLSERVRRLVAPEDLDTDEWVEIISAAHRLGLRSSSVMFYGHIESAEERVAHLRALMRIQSQTGGFTEFVPIPLPGHGNPLVPSRAPLDEHRAMFAVSRLMLSGVIPHIQVAWTRLGIDGAKAMLRCGGDDLGGTLLDGRVLPAVGAESGLTLPLADARRLAHQMFRSFRQRLTDYREPDADRKAS